MSSWPRYSSIASAPGPSREAAIEAGRFGRLLFVSGRIKWWRTQAYYDSGAWRGTWAQTAAAA